jgi:hypothetical protein
MVVVLRAVERAITSGVFINQGTVTVARKELV